MTLKNCALTRLSTVVHVWLYYLATGSTIEYPEWKMVCVAYPTVWVVHGVLCLPIKFSDNWGVVAGALCGARFLIYITSSAVFSQLLCRHNVVKAPAEIAFEGVR